MSTNLHFYALDKVRKKVLQYIIKQMLNVNGHVKMPEERNMMTLSWRYWVRNRYKCYIYYTVLCMYALNMDIYIYCIYIMLGPLQADIRLK